MSEHELWNELGNLYFMSGAYDQAGYAYHRSIQLDAAYGRPYSNLALTYVQQGRYEAAIDLYRRSLELLADDRERAVSLSRLGNVHRRLKDYAAAVDAYRQADALDPEHPGAHAESDDILYGSPDLKFSHAELMALAGSVPDSESVDLSSLAADRGPALVQDGETLPLEIAPELQAAPASIQSTPEPAAEAVADLPSEETPVESALETELQPEPAAETVADALPDEAPAETAAEAASDDEEDLDLSAFFEEEGEIYFPELDSQALADWLPLPEPPQPVAAPGDLLPPAAQAEPAEAGPAEYHVLESRPQVDPLLAGPMNLPAEQSSGAARPEPAFRLVELDTEEPAGGMYLIAEPEPDAERELEPAYAGSPDRLPDDGGLNIELEIPKLKRLVQVNPKNAVTWNTLGNLYKTAGQYKDAVMAYQQATSLDPGKAEYYHNLGMVYGAEGRDEDAIIALQKVLELKPDHSLTHATLGGYYQKMGLEELAQKHIGKAMKHIYDSESEYNRACLEAICGNTDQAIELLRVALENRQTYVDWVLRDPDLDMIREDGRFKQLISDFT